MGAAEVGRELGDAGGPLLVGAVAAAASLPLGLGSLAALLAAAAAVAARKGTTQETGYPPIADGCERALAELRGMYFRTSLTDRPGSSEG
jgi:hypothetical protein